MKDKILIGTPILDSCKPQYVDALFRTTKKYSDNISLYLEIGNNCIEDARNEIVNLFLEHSELDYLLFIDGDIEWKVEDIEELIKYNQKDQFCVTAGVYPKQLFDGESVRCRDKDVEYYTGQINPYGLNPVNNNPNYNKPVKSYSCLSGFMLINRKTANIMNNTCESSYKSRYGNELKLLFERTFSESEGLLGGEIYFCRKLRKLGGEIYVLPWVSLTHIGNFEYKRKMI